MYVLGAYEQQVNAEHCGGVVSEGDLGHDGVVQVHPSRGDGHHAQPREVHHREGERSRAIVAVQCFTWQRGGIGWVGLGWDEEGIGGEIGSEERKREERSASCRAARDYE